MLFCFKFFKSIHFRCASCVEMNECETNWFCFIEIYFTFDDRYCVHILLLSVLFGAFVLVFGWTFLNYICFYFSFAFSLLLLSFITFHSASLCSSLGQTGEKNACVFFLLFRFHWNTTKDDLLSMWLLTATKRFVFGFWFYFGFINYWTIKKSTHDTTNRMKIVDWIWSEWKKSDAISIW